MISAAMVLGGIALALLNNARPGARLT